MERKSLNKDKEAGEGGGRAGSGGCGPGAAAVRLGPRPAGLTKAPGVKLRAWAPHCETADLRGPVHVHECKEKETWALRGENTALSDEGHLAPDRKGSPSEESDTLKRHISAQCHVNRKETIIKSFREEKFPRKEEESEGAQTKECGSDLYPEGITEAQRRQGGGGRVRSGADK